MQRRSFAFNLVIVLALCIALYILFFAGLGFLTRHGNEARVPAVAGKTYAVASQQLQAMGFEVEVDSAYDPKQKPFIVLSQIPDLNSVVKRGRTIFLTVNKTQPPSIPMPNLLNLSFRSAEMILKSNKLVLGDTTYKPDIAKGAILDQLYKGQAIRPGQMLLQGSKIDLVIGDGLGNTQFSVPDVIGMTFEEAVANLNGTGLQFTAIWEGTISDSSTAIVYDQMPKAMNELNAPNRIKEGDLVDIRIKQSPTPEELEHNRNPANNVTGEETETPQY
ncbi:MAG: PASTA domain-containing protein [Sphingobacteriales bacterium]|nr:MAG: PASTA domain-containing protein [Sphingobacteriales bacterium]